MSGDFPFREPDAMTPEQLRDELDHWRANAAATLQMAKVAAGLADKQGNPSRPPSIERTCCGRKFAALEAALTGEIHERCEGCGEPLLQGQPVFQAVDGGELHADCAGDIDSFVGPDDQPLPEGSARPEPCPYDTGYDHARVVQAFEEARAFLSAEDQESAP